MRYVFVINPVSGKGKEQKFLEDKIKQVFKSRKENYKIRFTEYSGHATEIAEAEGRTGEDVTLFCCGGDGTIFEIVNGAYKYKNTVIAPYPIGSGNDFVKAFGNREAFLNLEDMLDGRVGAIDLIKSDDKVSINVASVGFDAHVAGNMIRFKKLAPGKGAYMLSIFYCMVKFVKNRLKITLSNGEKKSENYLFVSVANGRYYGGGFNPAPDALLDDGLLDVVEIVTVPRLKMIPLIGKYNRGEHKNLDICRISRTNKIKIETEGTAVINLDGEIIYKEDGVAEFELLPKAVKVLVPRKYAGVFTQNFEKAEKFTKKA